MEEAIVEKLENTLLPFLPRLDFILFSSFLLATEVSRDVILTHL